MEKPPPNHQTPLHELHLSLGARMTAFAGYDMPLQYPLGVMKEHLATRSGAGLFDVSHMGQIKLTAKSGDLQDAAAALEKLVPVDVLGLQPGRQRYALLTAEDGGILDDLMIANFGAFLLLVVNAACKSADFAHLSKHLGESCDLQMLDDRALLALQGPQAERIFSALAPEAAQMKFMDARILKALGQEVYASRSGYTGEDGYEISVPCGGARALAEALLKDPSTQPIGLGARDSLRLEAGLCLYGQDVTTQTTPVEAGLVWAISKNRRAGGAREGGFLGAQTILDQIAHGAPRKRVGLRPEGRAPIRTGALLFLDEDAQDPIGEVTSGVFGPTVQAPVAMGLLSAAHLQEGGRIFAQLRGKRPPVVISHTPFITPNYKR